MFGPWGQPEQSRSSQTPAQHAQAIKDSIYPDKEDVYVTSTSVGGTAESAYLRGPGWAVNWTYADRQKV
jgi:hypothetical protein